MLDLRPALIQTFRFNRSELHLGNFSYQGIGRLKPGATLAQASADVSRMLVLMFGKFPAPRGMSAKAFEEARIAPNLRPLKQDAVGRHRQGVVDLDGDGEHRVVHVRERGEPATRARRRRQQELAVRTALGASRAQVARELLVESVMLGLIGGALGVAVAYGAVRLLVYLAPANFPRLHEIAIDPVVLAFALVGSRWQPVSCSGWSPCSSMRGRIWERRFGRAGAPTARDASGTGCGVRSSWFRSLWRSYC